MGVLTEGLADAGATLLVQLVTAETSVLVPVPSRVVNFAVADTPETASWVSRESGVEQLVSLKTLG